MRRPLALALVALLGLAAAQDTSEKLQQLQQQLSQQQQLSAQQAQQLQDLRARLSQLGDKQKATLARLDALAGNISTLQAQGRDLKDRIKTTQGQIADLDARIAERQARVDRLAEDVRQLMQALYRERSGRYLSLLSQAKSLSDLLVRARYANVMGTENVRVIETLKAERAALDQERSQQVVYRDQLAGLVQDLQGKLAALVQQRGQQNALLAQLRQNQQGQQALAAQTQAQRVLTAQTINSLVSGIVTEKNRLAEERRRRIEEERRRREAELARLRAQQEAIRRERARLAAIAEAQRQARVRAQQQQRARQQAAAQEAAAQAQRDRLQREQSAVQDQQDQLQEEQQQSQQDLAPLPTNVGRLTFPLPGGRISSVYGATGPWVVLSGAPGGGVVAAAEGNVLEVVSYANTGWVVIVQHTNSVLTVYGGLSSVSVSKGQHISAGQTVGVTGGSPLYGATSAMFQLNVSGQSVSPGF